MRPLVASALLAGLALSCSKKDTPPAPEPQAPDEASASPGKTGSASISGRVALTGTAPPAPRSLKPSFPDCARFAGVGPPDPALVVSKQGGIREAFVWIKDGLPPGRYPVPAEPVTLDQKACDFVPRVIGVRAGQPVRLVNSDPMLHNTNGASAFNVPLLAGDAKGQLRKFARPGVMTNITCDVHGWMRAYAGVVAHPFFAVTGEDGSFSIAGLPAGSYTVEVWQERLGRKSQQVTVGDAEAKTVDFALGG